MQSTAQRIQVLAAEATELEDEIKRLVWAVARWLLELPGMGPIARQLFKLLQCYDRPDVEVLRVA